MSGPTSDASTILEEELVQRQGWPYVAPEFYEFHHNIFEERLPDARAFVGYQDELREVSRSIRSRTHVFIAGPIGAGKTAMMKSIYDIISKNPGQYSAFFVRIQKSRYEKELAKDIMEALKVPHSASESVADLYKKIMKKFEELYAQGIQALGFFDDVVNASEGTLRQILFMIPDVYDYEPTLVFNGTANVLKEVKSKVVPLTDRIGQFVYLAGLRPEDVTSFVNTRVRLFCRLSDWNSGPGCTRKQKGEIDCSQCLGPFSPDSLDVLPTQVGPYPRNLLNRLKVILEKAASERKTRIEDKFIVKAGLEDARNRIKGLEEKEEKIMRYLFKKGEDATDLTLTGIARGVRMSQYMARASLENLITKMIVIPKQEGNLVYYRLTPEMYKILLGEMKH